MQIPAPLRSHTQPVDKTNLVYCLPLTHNFGSIWEGERQNQNLLGNGTFKAATSLWELDYDWVRIMIQQFRMMETAG